MLDKKKKFILAIALQVAVIFAIILFKSSVIFGGANVLLQIEPVDPRDFLRGDYMTFRYNISHIDWPHQNRLESTSGERIRNGDTLYVILRQGGKYGNVEEIRKTKPSGGELFIKGKVERGGLAMDSLYESDLYGGLDLAYGIEQYFIPEGKGQNFSFWDWPYALVAIDSNGNAVLKQVFVDDKPWP